MSKKENMNIKSMLDTFQLYITDYIDDTIETIFKRHIDDIDNKEYYSLKEFADMFGLSVHAVKGRYRRKTLKVVYEGTTPLIPVSEVKRFKSKLDSQL